jgi:hypothetical protein
VQMPEEQEAHPTMGAAHCESASPGGNGAAPAGKVPLEQKQEMQDQDVGGTEADLSHGVQENLAQHDVRLLEAFSPLSTTTPLIIVFNACAGLSRSLMQSCKDYV